MDRILDGIRPKAWLTGAFGAPCFTWALAEPGASFFGPRSGSEALAQENGAPCRSVLRTSPLRSDSEPATVHLPQDTSPPTTAAAWLEGWRALQESNLRPQD